MPEPTRPSPAETYARFGRTGLIRRVLELARDEDLGERGDITSAAFIDAGARGRAELVFRERGVACGLACIRELIEVYGADASCSAQVEDGDTVEAGCVAAELSGSLRDLLSVERPMLNMVGRLSGIATLTARYVAALPTGSKCSVLDTRKTTPGLRVLEKYAVHCGGGVCHRIGLFDAVLAKDNHLARVPNDRLASVVRRAHETALSGAGGEAVFFQVEVDSLEQLRALLKGARDLLDAVLLDNMGFDCLREAVGMRNELAPSVLLEASGGVTLDTIAEIAGTGVDRVSVGALTHSARSLDVSLDVVGDGA